ncbi:unnamed protein product [Natator depressus]
MKFILSSPPPNVQSWYDSTIWKWPRTEMGALGTFGHKDLILQSAEHPKVSLTLRTAKGPLLCTGLGPTYRPKQTRMVSFCGVGESDFGNLNKCTPALHSLTPVCLLLCFSSVDLTALHKEGILRQPYAASWISVSCGELTTYTPCRGEDAV